MDSSSIEIIFGSTLIDMLRLTLASHESSTSRLLFSGAPCADLTGRPQSPTTPRARARDTILVGIFIGIPSLGSGCAGHENLLQRRERRIRGLPKSLALAKDGYAMEKDTVAALRLPDRIRIDPRAS